MLKSTDMIVVEIRSVSGNRLWELQRKGQTLSEPFLSIREAKEYRQHLVEVFGTDRDPLSDYWRRTGVLK
jgi:hypothetical protein